MGRKVVGIGETLLDIVFRDGQPVAAVPGGSTFNAIVSLGRTAAVQFPDIDILMVTRLGDDDVADIVTSFMKQNNVSTSAVSHLTESQTTISIATLDENNNAHYEFFRDNKSNEGIDLATPEMQPNDIMLFGSFYAVNPSDRAQVKRLLKSAYDAGSIIYYDVNFRKNHLKDLSLVKETIEENIAISDVVRASSEDIANLYGTSNPAEAYEKHISKLCSCFICTKGAEATEIFAGSGDNALHLCFPVPEVETVTTIGAGDNFNAGFIFGLLKYGIAKKNVASLDEGQWQCLVQVANSFAANVCSSIFNYVDKDFKCW